MINIGKEQFGRLDTDLYRVNLNVIDENEAVLRAALEPHNTKLSEVIAEYRAGEEYTLKDSIEDMLSMRDYEFYYDDEAEQLRFALLGDPAIDVNVPLEYRELRALKTNLDTFRAEILKEDYTSATVRENAGYNIIESRALSDSLECVIGRNPKAPDKYVCWFCKEANPGDEYYWGRYCGTYDQAKQILNERCEDERSNVQKEQDKTVSGEAEELKSDQKPTRQTLYGFLENSEDEFTCIDKDYDAEFYFYGTKYNDVSDRWDKAMYDLAKKLEVVSVSPKSIVVDLSGLIERNLDNLKSTNLFISCEVDDVMEDMPSILSGNVSSEWLEAFTQAVDPIPQEKDYKAQQAEVDANMTAAPIENGSKDITVTLSTEDIEALKTVGLITDTADTKQITQAVSESLRKAFEKIRNAEDSRDIKAMQKGFDDYDLDSAQAQIRKVINGYCYREFDCEADFSNPRSVDLAYTSDENRDHIFQVSADLVDARLLITVDDALISTVQYNDLTDLSEFLDDISFDDLFVLAKDEYEKQMSKNEVDLEIVDDVLKRCSDREAKNITIPDSVTSISKGAFYGCESLESVTIPDSVTSIGDSAFRGCVNLKSITLPDSVTSIGNEVFYVCVNLESVTIPDGVTHIGAWAFGYCESLESVIIPNSVTYIGDCAFTHCKNLKSITIPDSVTSIGYDAFLGCESLESVTIPDSVTSIGYGAFSYCDSLKSITIPNSVTHIGGWAFEKCTSLKSVTIPDSVTSIGDYAFYNCSSLKSISIPQNFNVSHIGFGISEDVEIIRRGCNPSLSVKIANAEQTANEKNAMSKEAKTNDSPRDSR